MTQLLETLAENFRNALAAAFGAVPELLLAAAVAAFVGGVAALLQAGVTPDRPEFGQAVGTFQGEVAQAVSEHMAEMQEPPAPSEPPPSEPPPPEEPAPVPADPGPEIQEDPLPAEIFVHSQDLTAAGKGLVLGDLDGDQDLDLLVGAGNNHVFTRRIFLNDGTSTFATGGLDLPASETDSAILGDVDGDGDLDLVSTGVVRIYLNPGAGFTAQPENSSLNESANCVALGDVDLDGDLDLFVGAATNRLYLNDGAGGFANARTVSGSPAWEALLMDLDGDGDPDLVSVDSQGNATLHENSYLEGGVVNVSWTLTASPTTLSLGRGIAAADVNGDGLIDLAGVHSSAAASLFLNQDNLTFELDAGNVLPTLTAVTLGDVDRDGVVDLLGATPGSFAFDDSETLQVYLNRGSDGTVDLVLEASLPIEYTPSDEPLCWQVGDNTVCADPAPVSRTRELRLGDLDRDGDLDLAMGNVFSNAQQVWLNTSFVEAAPSFAFTFELQGGCQAEAVVATADGGCLIVGRVNTTRGDTDAWVLKLGRAGDVEWEKAYGEERSANSRGDDVARSVVEAHAGGYFVAGGTYFNDQYEGGFENVWGLHLSRQGAILSSNVLGKDRATGNNPGKAHHVVGEIVRTSSGYAIVASAPRSTLNLALDMNGQAVSHRRYGSRDIYKRENAYGAFYDSQGAGTVIQAGFSNAWLIPEAGSSQNALVRAIPAGNTGHLHSTVYGEKFFQSAFLAIAGTDLPSDDGPAPTLCVGYRENVQVNRQVWLVKRRAWRDAAKNWHDEVLDAESGESYQFAYTFPEASGLAEARTVVRTADCNYLVGGSFSSELRGFVMKISDHPGSEGEVLWAMQFEDRRLVESIREAADGTVVVAGRRRLVGGTDAAAWSCRLSSAGDAPAGAGFISAVAVERARTGAVTRVLTTKDPGDGSSYISKHLPVLGIGNLDTPWPAFTAHARDTQASVTDDTK